MAWNQTLTNVRDVLAALYPTVDDSRHVVEDAGLNPAYIAFDNKAINNWHNILREADRRNKVAAIIDVANREYPENEWLKAAKKGDLSAVRGADIASDVQWIVADTVDHFEQIMGNQSTLLPISFLEVGLQKAKSVAKILLPNSLSGSGFLTENNLLITNNHVIASEDAARAAKVLFNYQQTADSLDAPIATFALNPDEGFATSAKDEHDWTAVRIQSNANDHWGSIKLKPATIQKNDRVNIIQHPGGGHKQIALYHNVVTFVDANRVQYLTDTMPGSSGSPVFDSNWQLVALHHSGGWLLEPGSKKAVFRNEGVHINIVIEGLKAKGLYPGA